MVTKDFWNQSILIKKLIFIYFSFWNIAYKTFFPYDQLTVIFFTTHQLPQPCYWMIIHFFWTFLRKIYYVKGKFTMWKENSAQHKNRELFNNYFKHSCEIMDHILFVNHVKLYLEDVWSTHSVSDRLLIRIVKWSNTHLKKYVANEDYCGHFLMVFVFAWHISGERKNCCLL